MLLIIITLLGLLFGTATVQIWQQSCSLQETATFAAQKIAREKYAQGVMAYACTQLAQDQKMRKEVKTGQIFTMAANPCYLLPGSVATITYVAGQAGTVGITVEVEVAGAKERLVHKSAVQ